jgi:hypothetical protein
VSRHLPLDAPCVALLSNVILRAQAETGFDSRLVHVKAKVAIFLQKNVGMGLGKEIILDDCCYVSRILDGMN